MTDYKTEYEAAMADLSERVSSFIEGKPLSPEEYEAARRSLWRERPLSERFTLSFIRKLQLIYPYRWVIVTVAAIACLVAASSVSTNLSLL